MGYFELELYNKIKNILGTLIKEYLKNRRLLDRFGDWKIIPEVLPEILNSIHSSIPFTIEFRENCLPFLDILINK